MLHSGIYLSCVYIYLARRYTNISTAIIRSEVSKINSIKSRLA